MIAKKILFAIYGEKGNIVYDKFFKKGCNEMLFGCVVVGCCLYFLSCISKSNDDPKHFKTPLRGEGRRERVRERFLERGK